MTGRSFNRIAEMTRIGVAAAVGVAREQGLPGDDPRLLSSRGNVLVHLAPAPVVARVATLTAWTRFDPFAWLAREVAVAAHLARRGGPVVPPTPLADPGPHRHGDLAVSLWTLLPASDRYPGPAETGRALARLHAAGADFSSRLPVLPQVADLTEAIAALEREQVRPPGVLALLRDCVAEAVAGIGAAHREEIAVLHGDAYPGNLLWAGSGWAWIDLEETCRGPREFDLAVLAESAGPAWGGAAGADGAKLRHAALTAYASELGMAAPGPAELAPFARAREVEGLVWLICMAHQYPARYLGQAQERLARELEARRDC